MATQIKVNSATGNVTVQLSRTVIGTVVTANTANYANFAGVANTANNLNATTTANVVIGGGTNGYVLGTNGAGSLSWVEQTGGGGAGVPGGANTQVQYNNAGAFGGDPAFTFNDVTNTLTTGTISATNIGNITPTNLDGNVANVLRGDGTFAADGVGSYGDSNVVTLLNAFGSNTINTTGNVDTGNLDVNGNLFIGNTTANVEIAPQGDFAFNSGVVQTLEQYTADYTGGPGAYLFNNEKAYVVNGYGTNPGTDTEATLLSASYYANDGTTTSKGFEQQVYTGGDALGTDPLVASILEQKVPSTLTNLANADTQTQTLLNINSAGPGIFFSTQSAIPADSFSPAAPVWSQMNYSDTSMRFGRRNGNADARTQVVANDYIGRIEWAPQSLTGGGGGPQLRSYPSYLSGKVSSAFTGANGERVGQGIEFGVVTDTGLGQISHEFHPNGDVTFNTTGGGTPITLGYNGVLTGDGGGLSNISGGTYGDSNVVTLMGAFGSNTITTTGLITGDGGGLSNVTATASPGGFAGTIQFNNSGTLDGDNRFQFNPTAGFGGTQPQIQLDGATGSAPGIFNINNGVLSMNTENLSGGYAPMSFSTYNSGGYMEPIVYYRAKGTRNVPTAVAPGDMIKHERIQCYSGAGSFPLTNAQAGSVISTVQANDGLGNIAASYTISTAKPANGPNSLDKIVLDTEYVQAIGNIEMTTKSAVFAAGLVQQQSYLFANLPSGINPGTRSFISDGATVTFRGAAVGGGTDFSPVFFDGGIWRYG